MSQQGDTAKPTAIDAQDGEGKQIARRALIAAAGLGVVGVVAAETPLILDGVKKLAEQQIADAFNLGRQALAKELASIEGVTVDVAIDAANVAHGAVQNFVVPIASLLSGVTAVTLDIASGAVEKAQQFTNLLNIDIQALSLLDGILKQWKANVTAFPAIVQAVNTTDTANAQKYLTTLKSKLKQYASS